MADAPEDNRDVIADLKRGLALIADKTPEYELREAMYEGTAREVFASPLIERALSREADRHPLSFAHIPVDALFDKVELADVSIEGDNPVASKWLQEVAEANDLEDEADDWHRKAGYFGDYYVIIDPQTEDAAGNAEDVKVVGSSPYTTVVIYSHKDGRTPLYGVKRWSTGNGPDRRWFALVYYDDVTVRLVTDLGVEAPVANRFKPLLDDDEEGTERVPHAGGRMLIVHYAVDGRPYGKPVHAKAFGAQEAITKLNAISLSTADSESFPERWALLDPTAEVDDDIDDDFGTNGPGTPASTGDGLTGATTGKSRVRTVPGGINMLRGVKQVGTWESGNGEIALKKLEFYIRAMAVGTGTPLFEFDLSGVQPSGESRRRAASRQNRHARKVKRALGRAHGNLYDTILAVRGLEAPVVVNWLPTETETDKEGIELVSLKIKAGVPIAQALLEAGYTDEQVAEWYPDGEPHLTPETLPLVATALGQLGQAVTLGAITEAEVAAMLPTILTGARNEGPVVDDEVPAVPAAVTLPLPAPRAVPRAG